MVLVLTFLDSRLNPEWFDKAKFGIFVHWGVYSVIGRGEWLCKISYYTDYFEIGEHWKLSKDNKTIEYMEKHYPGKNYADFAHMVILKRVQNMKCIFSSLLKNLMRKSLETL